MKESSFFLFFGLDFGSQLPKVCRTDISIILARYYIYQLTIPGHAEPQTFLKPAVLAAVAVDSIDDTVLVPRALVVHHGRLTAAKEALATLASNHPIVDAAALVPTHFARDYFNLS